MSNTLFKVGQKYKTKCGWDAVIYAHYPNQIQELHGAIYHKDDQHWFPYNWTGEGVKGGTYNGYCLVPPVYEGPAWVYKRDLTREVYSTEREQMLTSLGFVKIKVREVTE